MRLMYEQMEVLIREIGMVLDLMTTTTTATTSDGSPMATGYLARVLAVEMALQAMRGRPFRPCREGSSSSLACSGCADWRGFPSLFSNNVATRSPWVPPPLCPCCRPLNFQNEPGRVLKDIISGGHFSVFSTPLGPERKDGEADEPFASDNKQNHAGGLVAAVVPEEPWAPIPVGPCSGAELETPTGTCSTKPVNQPAISRPSASQPRRELETRPSVGMTHSGDGLDGLVEAPESRDLGLVNGLTYETGDAGIAAANWLDVTHAMLGAIDDPIFASR